MHRALDFYKKNGWRITLSRIQYKLRQKKRYSYKSLRNKFHQRFTASSQPLHNNQTWRTLIDSSAQSPLEKILKHLNIREDPAQILTAIKKSFQENTYCRVLDDLFTIERVLENTQGKHPYPLIQTSELPQFSEESRRKRILFITSQTPNPHHGGGNRILNFLKILSEDNDIYLATAYYPHEDDDLLREIGKYCFSLYRIPYWKFGDNQDEIRKWLGGIPMDIVHYEWPVSLDNYAPGFGRLHIFTYMEVVSLRLFIDMEKAPPLSPLWLGALTELIHALRIEVADTASLTARIAVTTKDGEFLRGIYPYQKYAVLNHGVNLDEFTLPDVESEPQTLVFVGNFGHYPNVDAMVYFFDRVWDDICKEIPDVKIYLIGPNPPKEITRFGDGRQVIITGSVPDVRPYIQKATICIAPLITGAGLRGKVIEYAALRRTFVATSIATTDLIYGNGIDYLMADTALDFSRKIIHLLRNGKLRQKMASSAYETTQQNYDTRRLVDFLYRLYDHLELERHQQ